MSKKELTKQTTSVAAYSEQDLSDWGASQASENDVVTPKRLIMQSNSSLVTGGDDLAFGDIIESIGKKKLAGFKDDVLIVPFHMKKVWIVKAYNKELDKFVFVRYEDVTADEENLEKEFVEGGVKHQRQFCRNFYCLIGNDPIPYIVPMKGMSTRTGKILATAMYLQNKMKKLPPPGMTFKLSATKEKMDDRTNAAYKIEEFEPTSLSKVNECLTWYKMINAGGVKEAEEHDLEAEASTSNAAPMF